MARVLRYDDVDSITQRELALLLPLKYGNTYRDNLAFAVISAVLVAIFICPRGTMTIFLQFFQLLNLLIPA